MGYLSEMKLHTGSLKIDQISGDQIEFYKNWYNPVVRELIEINRQDQTPEAISKLITPEISSEKIAESIEVLTRLGLLHFNKDGKLNSKNSVVSSDGLKIGSLVIRATQKKLAELAGESLEKIDKDERDISGLTVALKEKSFKKVANEIKKCRRRIIEIVSKEKNPDRVYRLNFHLFPLSKKIKEDKSE